MQLVLQQKSGLAREFFKVQPTVSRRHGTAEITGCRRGSKGKRQLQIAPSGLPETGVYKRSILGPSSWFQFISGNEPS